MTETAKRSRLDRPVDPGRDHLLGSRAAPVELVEYGSYACSFCRAANVKVAEARDALGDRIVYVFRHKPLRGSDLARRAAELAEQAPDAERFWRAHVTLMSRSAELTEDDLQTVARDLDVDLAEVPDEARRRVLTDEESARASGVADAHVLHQRPPLRRRVGPEFFP